VALLPLEEKPPAVDNFPTTSAPVAIALSRGKLALYQQIVDLKRE
jgi:hypothetical protein